MQQEKIEQHILKRYEVLKKLGSGAYGHVWKVRCVRTSKIFALKKIFDAFQHSTDAQRTYRQISILKQLQHPHIITLHEIHKAQNDRDIYLLFQYMQTDVHNVICQGLLQQVHKRYIVYQVLIALKYLHSAELVHRDLKPSNLLLNSDCMTKVCDFGLVRYVGGREEEGVVLTEGVATRWYRAPEVLLGSKEYNTRADMWSLGCIIAEIYLQKPLLPGTSILNQVERILMITGKPNAVDMASIKSDQAKTMIDQVKPPKVRQLKDIFGPGNQQVADFVSKLLQWNPTKRMTASEALSHPFLSDFANKKDEIEFKGKIKLEVNDNVKLPTNGYKKLIYSIAELEEGFESPKKFSDLRKNSANKDSKNPSNAMINYTSATKKSPIFHPAQPCFPSSLTPTTPTNPSPSKTTTVSPRGPFHRPKGNSPNTFKDIIQQHQQKQNRQPNGTFAGKLGEMLKPQHIKRGTIGDHLKSPLKQPMKNTFSGLARHK